MQQSPNNAGQTAPPNGQQIPVSPGPQPPYQAWTPVPSQPRYAQQTGQVPPPASLAPEYQAPLAPPVYGAPGGYQGPQAAYPPQGPGGPYQNQGMTPPDMQQGRQAPPPPSEPPKPGYRTPNTGLPGKGKKKRSKLPYVILALLVLAFGAYAVVRQIAPSDAIYGYVTAGTLSSRYTGEALVVRDEIVYTQEGVSQIDYVAEEGAQIVRTDNVCTVYTSGFNTKELTTLQKYRDLIKEYHKTLISQGSAAKDAKLTSLDTQVRDRAKETRLMVQGARGNLINQETLLLQSLQARQTYLKQKYPDDQKLSRLYDDENTQLQRISSWTKQYAAAADGLVSFYTDGYEAALNLSTYKDFSPASVRQMINGKIPVNSTATKNTVSIYRLVKNGNWAVLMLCSDPDWTPVNGRTYKLLIESFENTVVDATVESFTRSGGELLVRLSVQNADVKNVLYIRSCQVQLGENVDSLTVPTRALYSQMGQIGVVIVDEMGNNYWTPVTVISTEGDKTHIIPNNAGYLYEGMVVKLF